MTNGAPAGEKLFIFYNPPVVNRYLGIRRSYINETSRLAQEFLKRGLQTMVFANSRLHTEVLLTYLQQAFPAAPGAEPAIRGYRGGYLPGERREIERKLREGSHPRRGHDERARARHRCWLARCRADGRLRGHDCQHLAARRARGAPQRRFVRRYGRELFARSINLWCAIPIIFSAARPSTRYIQPDNLEILVNHLKCAAFELPLERRRKIRRGGFARAVRKTRRGGIPASQRRATGTGRRKPIRRTP